MVYVFDFFGVISSEVAPFWFAQHLPNYDITELRKNYMVDADLGKTPLNVFYGKLAELTNQTTETIAQQWNDLAVIDSKVVQVVENLGKNHQVALLSNAPTDLIRPILKRHDLERLFELIVISGEVGMVKPNQDIYLHTLSSLGSKPEETLFIDDNKKNVDTAKMLCMKTILYDSYLDIDKLVERS